MNRFTLGDAQIAQMTSQVLGKILEHLEGMKDPTYAKQIADVMRLPEEERLRAEEARKTLANADALRAEIQKKYDDLEPLKKQLACLDERHKEADDTEKRLTSYAMEISKKESELTAITEDHKKTAAQIENDRRIVEANRLAVVVENKKLDDRRKELAVIEKSLMEKAEQAKKLFG